jgi:hypothetical protein
MYYWETEISELQGTVIYRVTLFAKCDRVLAAFKSITNWWENNAYFDVGDSFLLSMPTATNHWPPTTDKKQGSLKQKPRYLNEDAGWTSVLLELLGLRVS